MTAHPLTWAAPRPLWAGAVTPGLAPAILRFASDDFMDQLLGLLGSDPHRLADHIATPETWRTPAAQLATTDLIERVPLPGPVKAARLRTRLARLPSPPAPPPPERLKLYQPAHQRYYITTATLACAIPGLPDRALAGSHEQVGFVLRRLMPERPGAGAGAPRVEYAYVKEDAGGRWQRVADGDAAVLAPGEERLPVFPLAHHDGGGVRRSLWGGLIPVGRREAYMAATVSRVPQSLFAGQKALLGPAAPREPRTSTLARTTEFRMDVAEPWKAMIRSALKTAEALINDGEATAAQNQRTLRDANLALQMQSWLILVDLAEFLGRHVKPVAAAIADNAPGSLGGAKLTLFNWLNTDLPAAERTALRNGLRHAASTADTVPHIASIGAALRELAVAGVTAKLDAAETLYQAIDTAAAKAAWPAFHFLLAGISSDGDGNSIGVGGSFRQTASEIADPEFVLLEPAEPFPTAEGSAPAFDLGDLDRLTTLVARALDPSVEADARPLPFAQALSQTMRDSAGDAGLFCLRFIHLNEDCGPLHPPLLSVPSAEFELASFFDSDAPARPVRISLPMDTSPAGLRKHARGTAFVLSNMLCGQVARARGLGFIDLVRQVLPWPFHKDIDVGDGAGCKDGNNVDIGMICSLSIPIVTLCALILMIIIVSLLDFIFRWLPWLVMCFPVPGLKAKRGGG